MKTHTYSQAKVLIDARRLRRQADGLRGQLDFLNGGGYYGQVTSDAKRLYDSTKAQMDRLIATANLLDPDGITVGR